MEFVKNQIVNVLIEDIGTNGEGVGRVDGFTLFVKDAVIGDVIEAKILKLKKNYGYARIEKIIEPGKDRVEPLCPVAVKCGGCSLQHLSYEKQLEWKFNKVKNCLERIGGLENIAEKMEPIYGMEEPYYYRNKAQFPVGCDKEGRLITGFYAGRTHSIIENTHCYIQAEINEQILNIVMDYCRKNHIPAYDEKSHTGVLRHILTRVGFTTGEIMVCLIINGGKKKLRNLPELVEKLIAIDGMTSITLNVNKEKTNRILGSEIISVWGQDYIIDYIGNVKYQISPLSFYQVNPKQTEVLYGKALEYADLKGEETVWDLYCGIGTISLFLAQNAQKVYGVEIVPQAIDDARINAKINGFDNVEFFVGKAEEVLPREYEKHGVYADVIVVDPPRKGCDSTLLDTIVMMEPKKVVYVSCDPATLARDVKILGEKGYQVEKVSVVDQFCHSTHVETVVLLQRKDM
jgi:23S rRNA (uracil1939-C5)-methyltransferase